MRAMDPETAAEHRHLLAGLTADGRQVGEFRIVDGRQQNWPETLRAARGRVVLLDPVFPLVNARPPDAVRAGYTLDAPFLNRIALKAARTFVDQAGSPQDLTVRLQVPRDSARRGGIAWLVDAIRALRLIIGEDLAVASCIVQTATASVTLRRPGIANPVSVLATQSAGPARLQVNVGYPDQRYVLSLADAPGNVRPPTMTVHGRDGSRSLATRWVSRGQQAAWAAAQMDGGNFVPEPSIADLGIDAAVAQSLMSLWPARPITPLPRTE